MNSKPVNTLSHLLAWEDDDRDPTNDVHNHFEAFGRWDWIEVAEEGIAIWNVMFDEQVEQDSAMGAVFYGVAAQGAHGAWATVAAALGVDPEHLRIACYDFEFQDDLPPPIGGEALVALARKEGEALANADSIEAFIEPVMEGEDGHVEDNAPADDPLEQGARRLHISAAVGDAARAAVAELLKAGLTAKEIRELDGTVSGLIKYFWPRADV